jgi:anti-sigma B factor antagonist
MSDFSVHPRQRGGACVLDLDGELDAHTASMLEDAFQSCLDEGHARIVVNGAELDYISSAGLGVFMAFVEKIREDGGDIKVAALQPKVYNVFDLLGFPMLFDIEDTVDEALARFEGGSEAPEDAATPSSEEASASSHESDAR